jgi:glycosyltransferase involved in cell wall biosynthesis
MTPRVTVVLAAYNHERFIAHAIESVLAQEAPFDWELVVFEDCSTDRTREIVCDYANRYPGRVRTVLSRHNKDYTRWLGAIQQGAGEYIAVLDGDDYWSSPAKLRKQVALMDAHPGAALSFHDVEIIYESSSKRPARMIGGSGAPVVTFSDLISGNHIPWSATMYRRAAVTDLPEWFLDITCSDWALNLLCARRGHAIYLPEVLGGYRRHASGLWSGMSRRCQLEELIRTTELFAEKFDLRDSREVRDALAAHWAALAVVHRMEGNRPEAARCLARARETRAFTRVLQWRVVVGSMPATRFLYRAWCKLQRVSARARRSVAT